MGMTAEGFLAKANGKVSAAAFLQEHRDWLLTGTRRLLTEPILVRLDNKEVFPTPALNEIKVAVMNHLLATNILNGREATSREPSKPIKAIIFNGSTPLTVKVKDKEGEFHDKEVSMSFDSAYKAEEWAARRLQENPGCHAEVREYASGKVWNMNRDQAFARLVPIKHTPTMRVSSSKGDKRLSGKPKVKGDKYYYPT